MIPVNRYFFSAPIFPTPEERKAYWAKVYAEAQHYRECVMAPQASVALTTKEEEDADVALVESWNDRRRASIYMLLYHQGMRESTAREILRKAK
jgi:hypothetical protein